jgi:hypothetical protein
MTDEDEIVHVRVSQLGTAFNGAFTIMVGPYARLVALIDPDHGVALEVYNTGTSTWVEKVRYTE